MCQKLEEMDLLMRPQIWFLLPHVSSNHVTISIHISSHFRDAFLILITRSISDAFLLSSED